MATGCWLLHDESPCEFPHNQWGHSSSLTSINTTKSSKPWVSIVKTQGHRALAHRVSPKDAPSLQAQNKKRMSSDHGTSDWGCGVRNVGVVPPRHLGFFAQPSPRGMEEESNAKRDLRWQREHMIITSKHLPDRAPLPDKGKPAVRRGRKATGQISDLAAGLPEEE